MRHRHLLPLAAVLLGCLCAAPAASATTETDSLGAVSASLSYTKNANGITYRNVRVKISRGGAAVLSAPIRGQGPGGYAKNKTVDVVDLDGDGEPEVLLALYSGGAHCCVSGWVYRFDSATSRYVRIKESYGDVGFKLRDLGGTALPEILTADPAFSYAFASYAESSFPIKIQRFVGGRFTDVTREFPALVRKDLATRKAFLREVRKRKGNPRGAIAAIAADQYSLGDAKAARATVARAAKTYGSKFASSLSRFLKRYGYAR